MWRKKQRRAAKMKQPEKLIKKLGKTEIVEYEKIRNPNCVVFIVEKWNLKGKKPFLFLKK